MIPRITQLEERLFKDRRGTYRVDIMQQLNDEKARLSACLQQSCSADRYRNTAAYRQCAAIEYAQAVIEAIWNIYHVNPKPSVFSTKADWLQSNA